MANQLLHDDNYSRSADWDQVWTEDGTSADNAAVTVTHAEESGAFHYIGKVFASYDAAAIGTLTIKKGSTTLLTLDVHNQREVDLSGFPLAGNAFDGSNAGDVSASLTAGGSGNIGHVSMIGITRSRNFGR